MLFVFWGQSLRFIEHRCMITDHSNKRYCFPLGQYAQLCIAWHKQDNVNTRAADTTWEWNLRQISGGYMSHCCDIIKCLSGTSWLEADGFAVSDEDIRRLGDDLHAEDTFADFHGKAAFSFGGATPKEESRADARVACST